MIFTDDDLKRLEKRLYGFSSGAIDMCWPRSDMKALLARLEAAEKVCTASEKRFKVWTGETYVALDDALINWRKACGDEK